MKHEGGQRIIEVLRDHPFPRKKAVQEKYAEVVNYFNNNLHRMVDGLETLNLALLGGRSAIVSVLIGGAEKEARALHSYRSVRQIPTRFPQRADAAGR